MNESINMYSAIVRSMNPRNLLTTSKNGKIYWLKTIAILLTVFISISHKHLKKSMVCVVDQNKYVHVISLFSIKNWKNVMEWNINVLIWFLVGPTSCANILPILFFTTGPNAFLINTIDFYFSLSFPWIFDQHDFNHVYNFILIYVLKLMIVVLSASYLLQAQIRQLGLFVRMITKHPMQILQIVLDI
jgi:hypothetical protein